MIKINVSNFGIDLTTCRTSSSLTSTSWQFSSSDGSGAAPLRVTHSCTCFEKQWRLIYCIFEDEMITFCNLMLSIDRNSFFLCPDGNYNERSAGGDDNFSRGFPR